ncbi:(deoxy)nucleoside triphosphate pyrophosphohydrolase [Prosthecochloris sp.]|uniref:(deoxy)nucleoside triphosphate pyrophosphohydrolase n=1 Tax=Prosthecochloris sp. TaxID=290513 RepID=UPI00257A5ABA|nr:(deoxy)nucleoside triphosphate pyrophosphohydrolase [Prosthecochloris sp.]
MPFLHIGRVVCAIIEREGRFLIAQRPARKSLGLKWEFPGGKVEAGESDCDALHRELMEELQIRVRIVEPLTPVFHAYEDFSLDLIPFRCTLLESGRLESHEHEALRWITLDEIDAFEFPEADIPVLEEYRNMVNSE